MAPLRFPFLVFGILGQRSRQEDFLERLIFPLKEFQFRRQTYIQDNRSGHQSARCYHLFLENIFLIQAPPPANGLTHFPHPELT